MANIYFTENGLPLLYTGTLIDKPIISIEINDELQKLYSISTNGMVKKIPSKIINEIINKIDNDKFNMFLEIYHPFIILVVGYVLGYSICSKSIELAIGKWILELKFNSELEYLDFEYICDCLTDKDVEYIREKNIIPLKELEDIQNKSSNIPFDIYTGKAFICEASESKCKHTGECANHKSAGEYRFEWGIQPQVLKLDLRHKLFVCASVEDDELDYTVGEGINLAQAIEMSIQTDLS